jgi:hypothetical protein
MIEEVGYLSVISGNGKTAFSGRLGLLLFDKDNGGVLALCAAQIVYGHDHLVKDGSVIGYESQEEPFVDHAPRFRSAASMIEKVRLEEFIQIDQPPVNLGGRLALREFAQPVDPWDHLGERVLLHTAPLAPQSCYLRSVTGHFRMPPPGEEEPVTFCDALVIEDRSGKPLTREGDAGAIITTLEGSPLGIVICGIGKQSFAAPVGPILEQDPALQLLTPEYIDEWNKTAARKAKIFARPSAPAQTDPIDEGIQRSAETNNAIESKAVARELVEIF